MVASGGVCVLTMHCPMIGLVKNYDACSHKGFWSKHSSIACISLFLVPVDGHLQVMVWRVIFIWVMGFCLSRRKQIYSSHYWRLQIKCIKRCSNVLVGVSD